jgi:hypothetical protein
VRRDEDVVEADDRQPLGHHAVQGVRGVQQPDRDQVRRRRHGGRRLAELHQSAQRGVAAGQRVGAPLEVALGDAATAAHELDVGVLATGEPGGQLGADEGDPPMPQRGQVLQPGQDPGAVVGVGRGELQRAGAGPQRHHRNHGGAEVGQHLRLGLHVAEDDDGIRVPRLQDGGQGDGLAGDLLGVSEHHVVPVPLRRHGEGLDDAGVEGVAEVADHRADQHGGGTAQAAGERVGPVSEPVGGRHHPLARLRGDRDLRGHVVEDPGHRALRDSGRLGDVMHRRGGPARAGPAATRAVGRSLSVVVAVRDRHHS